MERFVTGLRGWAEASHPFPLAAVVLLTALIGLASSPDAGVDEGRLLLVLMAMFLSQLAIGWANDYADRHTDQRFRPSKPVSAGRITAGMLPPAIVLVTLGSLAIGVLLGPLPLLLLIAGTAAGLSYDLWLKETRWSWAPFIVAFSVLPPYVWSSLDLFRTELAAIYLIAVPLVPAVHLANVLPDMDADVAASRRNLAVIFGWGKSLRVIAFCLGLPLVLVVLSVPLIDYERRVLALVLLVYLALLGTVAACYWRRDADTAFKVIVAASVFFTGGWLAAV